LRHKLSAMDPTDCIISWGCIIWSLTPKCDLNVTLTLKGAVRNMVVHIISMWLTFVQSFLEIH